MGKKCMGQSVRVSSARDRKHEEESASGKKCKGVQNASRGKV